jgi:LysM repeat protein
MRRNVLRYSGWIGIILLLALLVVSGCTRSKSSGPPEATDESGAEAATQPPGDQASPTAVLSGQEAIDATTTAWAMETATAEASPPAGQETVAATTPAATATEPEATATPEPAEATAAPEPTTVPVATQLPSSGEEQIHTVQPSENLFRISLNYGLDYKDVAAYNGIANPNIVYVGQEIKIPPSGSTGPGSPQPPPSGAKTHVVQPGENLFRVALQYGMLYTTLAAANDLSYPYTIYTGQVLIIP